MRLSRTTTDQELKMFVWTDVLRDWTAGMVCVLAVDLDHAHRLIAEKYPEYADQLPGLPTQVVTAPEAFAVAGGG